MSISDTTNMRTFSANGTTTSFSWPAYFEAAADIHLIVVDEDDEYGELDEMEDVQEPVQEEDAE